MHLEFSLTVEIPGNTTILVSGLVYSEVIAFIEAMRTASVYKGDRNSTDKMEGEPVFLISAIIRDQPFIRHNPLQAMPYPPYVG